MATLADLQRRRLELADTLRAVLPVARRYRDEQREQEIRELLARLAAGRFQLAVVGQFSRGKTTLMNALLGDAYLPTGALPTTSVITTVRYGPRARALVRGRATDLPIEVPVAEIARYVTQAGTDRGRMQVAAVDVELPAELLRLGFEFVDTPGIGSAIAANTAATLHYLPQADAVVFVTGYDSAITASEADLLARTAGQVGKLFLVINKRDLVSDEVAAGVTSYVRRWAREHLGADESQVFGMSALGALEAAIGADSQWQAKSDIEQFRSALTDFLTTGQGEASLRAVAGAAIDLVRHQQRDLSAESAACDAGLEREDVLAEFDRRMADLDARLSTKARMLAAKVGARVPALLDGLRPQWLPDLRAALGAATVLGPGKADEALEAALSALAGSGRDAAAAWLERQTGEVRDALIDAAASEIGPLVELSRSVRAEGAAIAGLSAADGAQGWSGEDLPDLLIPAVEWIIPPRRQAGHRPRRRQLTREQADTELADSVTGSVTGFAERACVAFGEAAARWAAWVGDDAARHARQEADRFRRYLAAPPRPEDVAMLAGLAGRLAGYLEPGTAGGAGSFREPATSQGMAVAAPASHDRRCAICGLLESGLTRYLVHRQFELATSEEEQARHADAGGFCPLHTWQYAQLASAVGISAGNAQLAEVVARALRQIGGKYSASGELAGAVERLHGAGSCAACAEVAAMERSETARLAGGEIPAPPPLLCMRHLTLVLQAGPCPEAAAAMVGTLASALDRAAEDMRSYALKREALRRALIAADEADAYRHALRLLAGEPALAQPWEPDADRAASR